MRDIRPHIAADGGSPKLTVQNILCHLDTMTDEQKAAVNWHAGQSVSLAVMRLIAIDEYRDAAWRRTGAGSRVQALLNRLRDQIEGLPHRYSQTEFECLAMGQTLDVLEQALADAAVDPHAGGTTE